MMAVYQFYREQKLPVAIGQLWDFISSPHNLKIITPPSMDFKVISNLSSEKMYPGMVIVYRVKPIAGIPVTWVSEITHVLENHYFVDEQRSGPYKIWHHEHQLLPFQGGTVMQDRITYAPPFGFIGQMANRWVIQYALNQIFDFRHRVLEQLFGNP